MQRARRVASSMIDRVVHDDEAQTLSVRFRNGRDYVYETVPRATYDALVSAPAAGAFFNDAVRGHFPCRRASKRYAP